MAKIIVDIIKKNMLKPKIFRLLLSFGLLLSLSMPAVPASAASGGSISLTSSKSTVPNGGTVIIGVYMNGGGNAINAVQTDISYASSKFQYIGFSSTGSAFEISAANGGSDGLASVARGTTGSVTGSALVGTMTFKALVGSGSAAFDVAGSSSLVSNGEAVGYGSSGASVNFGAAAPAPAGKTAAPVAPVTPKDTIAPVISAVKATAITPFSATVIWTTNEPADSVVEYGLDITYGLSASVGDKVATHSLPLSSAFLQPQTLLHYRVKSTDEAGNVATGTDQTLQLPGVSVTIVVRGPDGKPLANAVVYLDNATGITDSKGSVTLPSGLGHKKVTTTYQGQTVVQPVNVAKTTKPLPPVKLDLAKKPVNRWMLISAGLIVVVITLLAIDGFLFGSRLLARLSGLKFKKPAQPIYEAAAEAVPEPAAEPLIKKHGITVIPPHQSVPINEVAPLDDLRPVEPDLPQPTEEDVELDPENTVSELMEDAPAPVLPMADLDADVPEPVAATSVTPITIDTSVAQPIKISLQPFESEPAASTVVTTQSLPTAPELPVEPVAETQAAKVAKRLKKPAHKSAKKK